MVPPTSPVPPTTGELPDPWVAALPVRTGAAAPAAAPATAPASLSELVVVDQLEAQGWRVRHDERLDGIFEQRCDWIREYGRAGQIAVDAVDEALTYDELDTRANRLARYLRLHGASAGDRIALLFEASVATYVGLLAVLKIGATVVPLDADTPVERSAYVVADARARIVLTHSHLRGRVAGLDTLAGTGAELVFLDQAAPLIGEMSGARLQPAERGSHPGQLAYAVYAPSPSGWPVGVAIDHRSICNVVRVASEVYGLRGHRLYQGRAASSGAAVEEIWSAWAAGATLVPAPAGPRPRGGALHAFLAARRVTALSTTPTVLTTLEQDLPDLRFVMVSGEPCPQGLVARWYRQGRRFVNAYRPAGATVTATWALAHPDRPVTIGVPLPTFAAVVLDPDVPRRALRRGEIGEIGIAGIGLSCGYQARNHITGDAFVEDFLGIPGNPSGRIYRTGDLGRVDDAGEIEYRGHIDGQVYVQGRRVELAEVESVLLAVPGIASAVVVARTPAPGVTELAAFYTLRADATGIDLDAAAHWVRERLAPHAVPATLERVDAIPMTPQLLADRAALLAPGRPAVASVGVESPTQVLPAVTRTAPRQAVDNPTVAFAPGPPAPAPAPVPTAPAAAPSPVEQGYSEVLGEVLDLGRVPADAHFFDDLGADSMVMTRFCARLRKRPELPKVSIKDVYAHPTVRALATALAPAPTASPAPVAPAGPAAPAVSPAASGLAEVLAEVLDLGRVPADAHFFDDLGADSMVMARYCARLRKRADLPNVSMKDVYAHPTITSLATALAPAAAAPVAVGSHAAGAVAAARPAPVEAPTVAIPAPPPDLPRPAGTFAYLLCGFLQLLTFLGYSVLAGFVLERGYTWISTATDVLSIYVRAVEFGAVAFVVMAVLPIVAKWLLVGRWKPRQVRIWSLGYVRFWVVKTLVRANPLALVMTGTPLYNLYLRALGAKIGRNVTLLTKHVPVATDLLTIGEGTVVRKETYLNGYRARAGLIETGAVTLGRDVVVGEKTVLDIDVAMGDGALLGHASALHAGQVVPAGQSWHGSPAEPAGVDFRGVESLRPSAARKTVFSVLQLVKLFGVFLPLAFGGLALLLSEVPRLKALLDPAAPLALTSADFYLDGVIGASVIVFGGLLAAILVVTTVPRMLGLLVRPEKTYRLYGFHYSVHRTITRMTNSKLLVYLLGDSSFIVGYLRSIGYDLGKNVEQTGSNFGSAVTHETPFHVSVGTGTVIADGLAVGNAEFSATSFKVSRVTIGAQNFLGNHIAYPAGGRTGDNCLLATKVAIPIDGPVREGVGLLGSPAFEIPRSVQRDLVLDGSGRDDLRAKLRRKNRHNLVTLVLALLVRWVHVLGLVLLGMAAVDLFGSLGVLAVAGEVVASLLFTLLWFVLVERLGGGFRRRRPQACSIYDPIFWRHERYWKLVLPQVDKALVGTPFKNVVTRALGTRLGRRVFDNGAAQTERTLVTIGDDATLDEGSIIQCHSQEDGAFKSDRTVLGTGVTVGTGALVHYGVTIGDAAVIAPDSFVMKGEEVGPRERWGGNPAREMPDLARPLVR